MLPKKVVLVPIQSCRLFHKLEDMVEFTVVKILRRGLPKILILSVMSWMHLRKECWDIPASPGKCSQSCVSKLTFFATF